MLQALGTLVKSSTISMDGPIPPFYCVYLLRSKKWPARYYVGSTPDPSRRLRQHNGTLQGGAHKTVGSKAKPWAMAALVTGFPSSIAALQFEWAWQNPHSTRHIEFQDRITFSRYTKRMAKSKKGTMRETTKVRKGHEPIHDKFRNLHLLLRSPSFRRWPLELRLLSQESCNLWQTACSRAAEAVPERLTTHLDYEVGQGAHEDKNPTSKSSILPPATAALDLTYAYLKPRLAKSFSLLNDREQRCCACCQLPFYHKTEHVVICPSDGCEMLSHVSCLATRFIENQNDTDALLPTAGPCPVCNSSLEWSDLMRELSFRTTGTAVVTQEVQTAFPAHTSLAPESNFAIPSTDGTDLQRLLRAAKTGEIETLSLVDIVNSNTVKQNDELPNNWDEIGSSAEEEPDSEEDIPVAIGHNNAESPLLETKQIYPEMVPDSEQEEMDELPDSTIE